jgi:hypothetical protein
MGLGSIMRITVKQKHNQAMLAPNGKHEKALVQLVRGLKEYEALLEGGETEAVAALLVQGMSDIARGILKLTQGPLGRLDAELMAEDLLPLVHDHGLTLVATEPEATEVLWFPLRS